MYNKMNDNKKFKIITSLEDDAPYGHVHWCSLSFNTPQKLDSLKFIDVKGFRVYNGYATSELAVTDSKKLKEKHENHDVYLSQLGKIYAWDDVTKSDSIEYDNQKLNELEKSRKESFDKIKLMSEQFKNEYNQVQSSNSRLDAQKKRLQDKLYSKGMISKQEFEMMNEEKNDAKNLVGIDMDKINAEIDEAYKTDYLDECEPTGLKFGCVTFYSPRHIGGLCTLCFKVRGLFETVGQLTKRVNQIKKIYPDDRIYTFEIGKWCSFAEKDGIEEIVQLKQLNYSMKCYLENVDIEKEEFDKRTKDLQERAEQESNLKKTNIRKERRAAKQKARRNKNKFNQGTLESVTANESDVAPVPENVSVFGDAEDDAVIQKIMDYIDDPELRNKYAANKDNLEKVEVNVSAN